MKPAISVILLTTLIGAAQGLFLAQFGAHTLVLLGLLPATGDLVEFIAGGVISLLLLVGGLLASFFHLGHPERAWRAATMWRTSWLSREVIVLPITLGAIFACTLVVLVSPETIVLTLANGTAITLYFPIAVFAVFAVLALFVCTSMIYACLKFLRQWHSPLTVCNFFLLGCASGCTLATAVAVYFTSPYSGFYAGCAYFLPCLRAYPGSLH